MEREAFRIDNMAPPTPSRMSHSNATMLLFGVTGQRMGKGMPIGLGGARAGGTAGGRRGGFNLTGATCWAPSSVRLYFSLQPANPTSVCLDSQ